MNSDPSVFAAFSSAEVEKLLPDLLKRDDGAAALMGKVRAAIVQDYLASEPPDMGAVSRYFQALQFGRVAPPEWREFVVDNVIVPIMREAIAPTDHAGKMVDLALALEVIAYEVYVKGIEREDHFKSAMGRLAAPLIEIGQRFAAVPMPRRAADPNNLLIGFYLPSGAMLANAESLFTMLSGLGADKPFTPIVFVLSKPDPLIDSVCKKLKVHVVFLASDLRRTALDCALELVRASNALGVDAMVFVSNVVGAAFLVAAGVAPVTVWWSMKYHDLDVIPFTGRITTESNVLETIDRGGVIWHCTHPSLPVLFNETRAEQVKKWRRRIGCDEGVKLIGCYGRSEKMIEPDYLGLIADLLAHDHAAHFVFTGRYLPNEVVAFFRDRGVDDRAHFLGWIDMSAYAALPDMIVDSFPFGSGYTSFGAMQAAVPVLGLLTPETMQASAIGQAWQFSTPQSPRAAEIAELFTGPAGERLRPWCDTYEELKETARAWLDNADLRRLAGLRHQQFIRSFMSDPITYGATFNRAIRRILGVA